MAKKGIRWTTFKNNGVLFPPVYKARFNKGFSDKAEKMLFEFSKYVSTDYFKNSLFVKNFYNDLKPELTKEQKALKFPEDYMSLLNEMSVYRAQVSEAKKNRSKEEKLKEKEEKLKLQEQYGYAEIDGVRTKLTTYIVEDSRIFIGRGNHPKLGCWIEAATPEDVTINCSNISEAPLPPEGHKWKLVECNPNTFMAWYYDLPKIHAKKFATVSQDSDQGMDNNRAKFDKVKNLVENWTKVNNYILDNLKNSDPKIKEAALTSYLIKNFGIRIGNDTRAENEDFANDVVGASTLRKENLKCIENNQIVLDFIGKDSVKFHNTFTVEPIFYEEISKKLNEVKDGEFLFPNITSQDVNNFLGEGLPGLTAKNFRTAYGSALLSEAFRQLEIDEDEKMSSIKIKMEQAQLKVAEKLNHKRTISKKQKESYSKAMDNFSLKKEELENKLKEVKEKWHNEQDKAKKEKLNNKRTKLQESLELLRMKRDLKKGTADSSSSTSKQNYSDPRVIISFCNDKKIPIEKVYTPTLLKKFQWAVNEDTEFYKEYPEVK